MADEPFVTAVDPHGTKRVVPAHYLDNPAFGFKLAPSQRISEPQRVIGTDQVFEPAAADTTDQVQEQPAATAKPKPKSGAAGENEEAAK